MATFKEINECWYFVNEKDANEHNKENAVGYIKTENGVFVCEKGIRTDWKWIESNSLSEK